MKYRKDFVTNSSSSSFVCDICGAVESGWDMTLSEAEMVHCVNDHTICEGEILQIPRENFIQTILEYYESNIGYLDSSEIHSKEDLEAMDDDDLMYEYFGMDDARYCMPEACCPICQFIEYSKNDMAKYLEKKYGVSRADVFAEVKKVNRRRKKLYDSEYITHVCKMYDLDPIKIASGWKTEFGSYREFSEKYL